MKDRPFGLPGLTLCLCAVSLASVQAAPLSSFDRQAREILEATGVQGGLVVHIGCTDAGLTAALRASDSYLVHGLDKNPEAVERARGYLNSLGRYGPVSVDVLSEGGLPYIDNVVNLVVAESTSQVPMAEIVRVLAPNGVACVRAGSGWTKTTKPRPDDIDEWSHYLHGPDNNAVARDRVVSYPFHIQWVGDPKWARHHNHLAGVSAMVSSGGRIFAIVDEGPIASINQGARWSLVARDAFNGVVLWKRAIGPWEGHLRPFRSGPLELCRRLVAAGDGVYATLGYGKPLTALDAATGKIIKTYGRTEGTLEILTHDGVLYLVIGMIDPERYAASADRHSASPPPRDKRLLTLRADTGEILWMKSDADTHDLLPTTLCLRDGRIFFHSAREICCLDATSGRELWRTSRPTRLQRLGWSTPTVVAHEDVVLCADCAAPAEQETKRNESLHVQWTATARPKRGNASAGVLIAYSATDGRELWRCPTAQGYNAPADLFVADGLVWTSTVPNLTSADFTEGRDLHTGRVERRLDTAGAFTTTHHHRCYRNKATDQFILLGRTGVEFIALNDQKPQRHCWIRGTCQYGVLPCNGLLYLPPHSCACYIQSKLSGFWALAPRRDNGDDGTSAKGARLEPGPAYGAGGEGADNPNEWPTYRHDVGRRGSTASAVGTKLTPVWEQDLGGRLTSPVIGAGKVLVASVDRHAIHALNAQDGGRVWTYVAGGRVDSPPTVYGGMALFGSSDGYVYGLRLSNGALAWRFRAAPVDRRTIASGQVESVWPVTGSVLVRDGVVYCTAGRSSYLDGGMYLYRLDAGTGRLLGQTCFSSRDPESGEQPEAIIEDVEMPGALPDVLSCDGRNLFLRDKRLDLTGAEQTPDVPHLYSSAGLLDPDWWHRTYWIFGTKVYGRASGWSVAGNYVPSGRLLVLDDTCVYGYGRKRIAGGDRGLSDVPLHLFRADQQVTPLPQKRPVKNNNLALVKHFKPTKVTYHWSHAVPMVVRAMVLADGLLFAAGPSMAPGRDAVEPTFDEASDAVLMVFDGQDGRQLVQYKLDAQPVFDGMAAAYGRLFLTTMDGKLACRGGPRVGADAPVAASMVGR